MCYKRGWTLRGSRLALQPVEKCQPLIGKLFCQHSVAILTSYKRKRKKKQLHTCPPIGTNNIKRNTTQTLYEVSLASRERKRGKEGRKERRKKKKERKRKSEGDGQIIVVSFVSALESFWGEGSGQTAASTRSNGHTGLLPCAQLIIIIIIITLALYSYTFYTEMPQDVEKLGSNYIKVPNSETYDTY